MLDGLRTYSAVWLVDFEFSAPSGERPVPLCLVAREFFTGRLLRIWLNDGDAHRSVVELPFDVGAETLYIAFYASAELGCHRALNWPLPVQILDMFVEFRNLTNGRGTLCGNGLLGAMAHFGLPAMESAEKEEMRALAMRGGSYMEDERQSLLDYCQTDVDALAELLPAMMPNIDLPRALLRGRYMAAAARMEWIGTPVDAPQLRRLRQHWDAIQIRLIRRINQEYGVYVPRDRTPLQPDSAFGRAVLAEASAWGLDADDLAEAADTVWKIHRDAERAFFEAKKEARRVSGLTTAKLNRWEDSYKDSSSWPRLDETARELAGRFPELGIGPGFEMDASYDSYDYAGTLWEILREPEDRPKPKQHPDILSEAVDLSRRMGQGDDWRPMKFSAERWAVYLAANDIPWPRLPSGSLALDDDTFRQMARQYPEQVGPIRELRHSLGQLRLNDLAVGSDGRNRCLLSVFRSSTGRNQPSNSRFIFGPSCWLRSLIKPESGRAIAYVDWSQQEFGIAAALSGDRNMKEAYASGDPYLTFAKQAGAVPADATKQSHPTERGQFKVCALAVQYGMGEDSLAQALGDPPVVARELLRLHRQTYPDFWRWSKSAVDHAMLHGWLQTVFGWRIHVGTTVNPRSLANFPCQANGAEMLRLACCLATERGIRVCAPVHDAVLIEAAVEDIDDAVRETQLVMREASEIILPDFSLRTDADVVRWPDRYRDERGAEMWTTVCEILDELDAEEPADFDDHPGDPPPPYLGGPPPTTPAVHRYPAQSYKESTQ
ncbi:MAG: hypothetical protein ACI8P0_002060 [Planctomycetaceae bacterium]|jgi:hypothetical protein